MPSKPSPSGAQVGPAHHTDEVDTSHSHPVRTLLRRAVHRAIFTVAGIAALTASMLQISHRLDLDSVMLVYLLAVVVVAIVTDRGWAMVAAVACWLLANFLFISPNVLILSNEHLVELAVLVMVSALVSFVVEVGARHREAAFLHRRELQLLSDLAAINIREIPAIALMTQVRAVLGMRWVRLVHADGNGASGPVAQIGDPSSGPIDFSVEAGNGLRIEGCSDGRAQTQSWQVQCAIADNVAHLWNEKATTDELARTQKIAEVDRLRETLLAAVSHDLRTPLANIKAHASALRQPDISWPDEVRSELLTSIEETADQLTDLVSNLLAMTRLKGGTLKATLSEVHLYEIVGRALAACGDRTTFVEVPDDLPPVLADQMLLERIVVNLLTNSYQYAGGERPATVRAVATVDRVSLTVVDHGPGIHQELWADVFKPFQRFHDGGGGLGLGLAIAKGFGAAMNATVTPSQTPGGGLTMTVVLRRAR